MLVSLVFPEYEFLTYTYSSNQTLLLKMALEREEIPYQVRNENVNQLFQVGGIYNPIFRPVEFYVPAHCLGRARSLLSEIPPIGGENPLREEEELKCPACGASFPEEGLTCPACGFSFA